MNYIKLEILNPSYFGPWVSLYNLNYVIPELRINFKLTDDPPKPLPEFELDRKYIYIYRLRKYLKKRLIRLNKRLSNESKNI